MLKVSQQDDVLLGGARSEQLDHYFMHLMHGLAIQSTHLGFKIKNHRAAIQSDGGITAR